MMNNMDVLKFNVLTFLKFKKQFSKISLKIIKTNQQFPFSVHGIFYHGW